MIQIPIVRQILLDPGTGLLPYLSQQLQTQSFSHFKSQFGFYVDESCTQVTSKDDSLETQTILLLTLKLSILVDSQTPSDEAAVHALEFQELLDAQIIRWSQDNENLLQPISSIKSTFSQLSDIPFHGGYLPGFEIKSQFTIVYSPVTTELSQSEKAQYSLHNPGERTPISGQYEVINSNGKSTGLEVTSTAGNPFPPTSESDQSYRLVDPTKHKKSNR
ncbi:hypothetical protein [Nostoc sp. 'Peltigera membranacea cyanobiont' N6]|uniref:hypothetical protein n=1 Tax=Nostoc sp. 'Peltigera membranacea cyanobiont' N6 TaxID=1261031 RepID=UPI000D0C43A4|nr:hypothetical protein [Nostoc sp. 'Peltigera membranacea cyanobiont' N6]AVH63915.1 hypothetical protein NPM_2185 [Nostoc sp. 'Peltigera membranacea cyanobiont' N6]